MYSFSNANFRFTIEGLTVRSIPAIETTIITKDYGTSTVNIRPFAVWCGWVCQVVTVLRSSLPQVR